MNLQNRIWCIAILLFAAPFLSAQEGSIYLGATANINVPAGTLEHYEMQGDGGHTLSETLQHEPGFGAILGYKLADKLALELRVASHSSDVAEFVLPEIRTDYWRTYSLGLNGIMFETSARYHFPLLPGFDVFGGVGVGLYRMRIKEYHAYHSTAVPAPAWEIYSETDSYLRIAPTPLCGVQLALPAGFTARLEGAYTFFTDKDYAVPASDSPDDTVRAIVIPAHTVTLDLNRLRLSLDLLYTLPL